MKNCNSKKVPCYNMNRTQQNQHEEGEQCLKSDGEVYTTVYNTECRVCELVWEAFNGVIPQDCKVVHVDGNKQNNRLDNLKLEKK